MTSSLNQKRNNMNDGYLCAEKMLFNIFKAQVKNQRENLDKNSKRQRAKEL